MRFTLSLVLVPLLASPLRAATPPPAPAAPPQAGSPAVGPPVITTALAARLEFVAWLPVAQAPNDLVLDVRVEAVLPHGCGDKLVGLLAHPDAPDVYDIVIERRSTGECDKEAVRVGARQAIRVTLPDGATKEVRIGERAMKVARKGKDVTVDGEQAAGDVPGAPPTARPSVLVTGAVSSAKIARAQRVAGWPSTVSAVADVKARFGSCVSPPVGLLGRGDESTHFALTRFEVIARLPQDQTCGNGAAHGYSVPFAVRVHSKDAEQAITIGGLALSVRPSAPTSSGK